MFDIERVRASWQREAAAIDAVVLQINETTAHEPIRSDGWTTHDLLGHVANAARAFVIYTQRDPGKASEAIDVHELNEQQRAKNKSRPWDDVQAYWQRARDEVAAFLNTHDNTIGERPVHLPWLPDVNTAGIALRTLIIHTRSHREELEQAFPPVQA